MGNGKKRINPGASLREISHYFRNSYKILVLSLSQAIPPPLPRFKPHPSSPLCQLASFKKKKKKIPAGVIR